MAGMPLLPLACSPLAVIAEASSPLGVCCGYVPFPLLCEEDLKEVKRRNNGGQQACKEEGGGRGATGKGESKGV